MDRPRLPQLSVEESLFSVAHLRYLFSRRIAMVTILSVCGCISGGQVEPQALAPREYRSVSLENYERILDLVFPPMPPATKDVIFAMRIRFVPSFEPESQVVVLLTTNKGATVNYAIADEQIYDRANTIFRGSGPQPPAVIAGNVRIRNVQHEVERTKALAWQHNMFKSVRATLSFMTRQTEDLYSNGTRYVSVDGTTYELSYAQGLTEFTSRLSVGDAPTFTKWAEKLRTEIANLK